MRALPLCPSTGVFKRLNYAASGDILYQRQLNLSDKLVIQ